MSAQTSCADVQVLKRLVRGKIVGEEAEALEQHLLQCDRCAETVNVLASQDTVAEAIRGEGTLADEPDSALVRGLVERLRGLRPCAATPSGETPPSLAPAAAGPDALSPDATSILAPAQGPEEIGRLGPYRVLRVLGGGGMGIVFEAEDPQLRRRVALKALKPALAAHESARQRFLREARAAAAIEHDHVVTIHQVGEERGVPFLAMALLRGETLEERLDREGTLPTAEVLRVGREIAEGLAAAHERGLVHRDVKPSNVWLEAPRGRVKLVDFGLARAVSGEGHLTQTGFIVGTPQYMAPEQGRGEAVDGRSDLFSLGCVLYRLCTGRPPFQAPDAMSTLLAVATEHPRPPRELNPDVPPALNNLVLRLLAKNVPDRPSSARAVVQAIEAIEHGTVETSAPPPAVEKPAERAPELSAAAASPRRRRGLLVATAVLAVLLPVGAFLGGPVLRFATNKGELVVRVDDPDVEVVVRQQGVVVVDRTTKREFVLTAGDGEVEVYEKESGLKLGTKAFTLTRGGKERVHVTLDVTRARPGDGGARVARGDLDRRAAEWVLSVGGYLDLDVAPNRVKARSELPVGHFHVLAIYLGHTRTTDGDLERLIGLSGLRHLDLTRTSVTDAGIKSITRLDTLSSLSLNSPGVTAAGVEELKELKGLRSLGLYGVPLTDADLARLGPLVHLENLYLGGGPGITDAGLVHLKGFSKLGSLVLVDTKVAGAGLAPLKNLPIEALELERCAVTDDGLKPVRNLTRLWRLNLRGNRVTDAGLAHLRELKRLANIDVRDTNVTAAGVAALRAALPECKVASQAEQVRPEPLPPIKVGEPISALALVGRPAEIKGVRSWSIDTRRPRGRVLQVAHSPDGRWLASAGDDATVRIWEADTGRLVQALLRLGDIVAWSPDGKVLVTSWNPDFGPGDGKVRLWDVGSWRLLQVIPTKEGFPAWSPRGNVLATARDDGVWLWDVAQGRSLRTLTGADERGARKVAWSPDGRLLAGWALTAGVAIWDSESGRRLRTVAENVVASAAWSPDGKVLGVGTSGAIQLWEGDGSRLLRTLEGPGSCLAWSPDGGTLAAGEAGTNYGCLHLWDVKSGRRLRALEENAGYVYSVSWGRGGKMLASATNDTIRFWDAASGDMTHKVNGHATFTGSDYPNLAWSPDSTTLAWGGRDLDRIWLWNTADGTLARTLVTTRPGCFALAWSPDGRRLASADKERGIHIWESSSGKRLQTLEGHKATAVALAWSPDGKTLASSGYRDGTVRLWDAASGKILRAIEGHQASDRGVLLAWSPDGRLLACLGDYDETLRVYEAASGKRLHTLRQPRSTVIWSPDGKALAAGGGDGKLRLWDVQSGELLDTLEGHKGEAWPVAWLPDGKTLVSAGSDGTQRYWDAAAGRFLRKVEVPGGAPSPDRRAQATVVGCALRLWDSDSGQPLGAMIPLPDDRYLAVSPEGHFRPARAERELVYVVQTEKGQETLSPEQFAQKYGWKNDPDRVRLTGR